MSEVIIESTPFSRAVDKIWLFFSSVKLTIVLLLILGAAMGYGTYVETVISNGAARLIVYRTWWFDSLVGLLALNLIGCTLRRAPYKPHQAGWLTTHVALLLIMAGSVVTHRFGMQGQIVIPVGESEQTFFLEQLDRKTLDTVMGESRDLPFRVKCVSFEQLMYPGTQETRMFRSKVQVLDANDNPVREWDVILNHPLYEQGYKISQASWIDLPDGRKATVLGVAYDPGTPLIYFGSFTLVLGMFGIFFMKPYLKRKFPPKPIRRTQRLPEDTEMTAELNEQNVEPEKEAA